MKLVTDHAQWYDDIFDSTGWVFHRMAFTRGGLTKRQQLALLERMGYRTPVHGEAAELHARLTHRADSAVSFAAGHDFIRCVVYHDELAHRGEGKEVMRLAEAAARFPNCLATVFHPPAEPGLSFRFIRLGALGFWQRQQSGSGDWRSNRHDQERVLERRTMAVPNPIQRVLWAVDFVPAAEGLLAVDFNTAPDLTSLGESGVLTTLEIHAELEAAGSRSTASLEQC